MTEVVFVDDEPSIVRCLLRLAKRSQLDAVAFSDPRQALEWLGEHGSGVKVVVSDYRMHHLSGLDLLRQLPAHVDARFVLLTGDVAEQAKFDQVGIARVIQKPVQPRALLDEIQHQLALSLRS